MDNINITIDEITNDIKLDLIPIGEQGLKGDKGDSFQYSWTGTTLGVKTDKEPTYTFVNLKGETGDSFEYAWDGTTLKVKTDKEVEYASVDLKGDTGDHLQYVWNGTQLGVKTDKQLEYTYVELKGEKGDQGIQGIQGIQGVQGIKGDKGDQGIQGIQGVKGDTGTQGIQGIQGIKGDQGIQGIQGVKGDVGEVSINLFDEYLANIYDDSIVNLNRRTINGSGVFEEKLRFTQATVDADTTAADMLTTPSTYSQGKLYSVLPEDGSLDYTVDRNSTATRVNKDGIIEVVPANTPRIDYSTGTTKILREGQSTNLVLNSEPVNNASQGGSGIIYQTYDFGIGFNNVVYYGDNSVIRYRRCFTTTQGEVYTHSYFVKMSDLSKPIVGGVNQTEADFSIEVDGFSIGTGVVYTEFPDNIWRVSITKTGGTVNNFANGIASHLAHSGKGFRVTGWQIEQGSKATSYIPTNGTSVTRLADKLTIPDNRLTAYINDKVVINPSELDETTAIIKGYSGLQSQATIDAATPSVIQYGVQSDITKKLQLARKHAEPSLMMLPAKGGAGNLQSILPDDGTGDFTVDRNSTASYVAEDGTIKTALANEPRFDWSSGKPALLVEGQATNLINYSLININWGKRASVTPTYNYGVAPDGTLTSTHLTWDNVNYSDAGYVWQSKGITKSSTAYTFSFWGKGSGTVEVWIWNNSPSSIRTTYTLTSEWQRFESTTTTSAGALSSSDYGFQNYTDLEVWGVQLEEASTATSYIPTSGSTVTRLGEQIRSVPEGISNIQGTLFIDFNDYFTAHGAISMGKYKLYRYSGHYEIYDGGWISNKVVSKKGKIAIRYNSEGTSIFINGVDETKVNTPAPTTPFNFDINITRSDNQAMIKSLNHYPTALTDEQLIELTTPYYNSYSEMAEENNYTIQ